MFTIFPTTTEIVIFILRKEFDWFLFKKMYVVKCRSIVHNLVVSLNKLGQLPVLGHIKWTLDVGAARLCDGLLVLRIRASVAIEKHLHRFLCLKQTIPI